jgi:3-oxoacyl-[acyl-carrier-protein] synthase-3
MSEGVADVLRKLTIVFTEFEGRLEQTPLIRKLTRGRFELADYQAFLVQLRQQVKDGALWMSRAASNIGEEHLELRSTLMKHAVTEHRDFRILEADYVATGGAVETIRAGEKNVGSEALSAWMFHEASKAIRSGSWARCGSSRAWARSRRRSGAGR